MKTLHVFLVSLFAFQTLLLASTAAEARRLLTLESSSNCWFMKAGFGGRPRPRPPRSPPPPPGYSPGPTPKLKSPPSPYIIRGSTYRRRPPPPPPGYSPGPTPKRRSPPGPYIVIGSLPATSEHAPALKDLVYEKSPPNPYAASA